MSRALLTAALVALVAAAAGCGKYGKPIRRAPDPQERYKLMLPASEDRAQTTRWLHPIER